ncbi:glycoside hydrolase family 10 protein [Streptobacillus moniliformis]|uniref:glycoside hydrolase family 10 protein n=1 Tax=Streptobacillus moniliformis TaxID=34105 RepID=UPI0007E38A0E|nr:family 10 glycosylhydrolase [Streptobacillus moniliformis]
MKKIIASLAFLGFLISCSSVVEQTDLYKDYKPKYKLGDGQNEEIKITSKTTNKEILSNEKLTEQIFKRENRKINKNLKGVWAATVVNLDFPKTTSMEEQKREIDEMMENIKKWGLNAVFFHVRPAADALYNSEFEPWSIYLTGTQNRHPGYDPLEYAIKAAHKRGIELHAWINPYRAAMNTDLNKLSDKSIVKRKPEWIFEYDGKFYMNPGNPEVVNYVSKAIEEIVEKYDIDGLHLDDYFYPYPSATLKLGDNVDQKEFEKYGSEYNSRGDWRRDNVNNMIKNLSVSVHKIKPNLSFGVSPFGIWRNYETDARGSKTKGLQSYDSLYADSLKWMKEGWVDYIAPQIYWNIGFEKADYEELVKWWAEKSKETNTSLYVGHGVYKYIEPKPWKDSKELEKQLKLNEKYDAVKGSIFFRYGTLLENPSNILDQIEDNLK